MNSLTLSWFVLGTVIIATVLITNPKDSNNQATPGAINLRLTSSSDIQKTFELLTWLGILLFFGLTLIMDYVD